jgi:hypothetical protein
MDESNGSTVRDSMLSAFDGRAFSEAQSAILT